MVDIQASPWTFTRCYQKLFSSCSPN
nr:unnamed protein product [Callosobruchus chinensis]